MRVCYFGNYDPHYCRNRVLIRGLLANGIDVIECQTRERGVKKYLSLYRQHRNLQGRYDTLIVGFSGWSVLWFAKLLTRKKIVFDAFSSLYLSEVEDRQNARKGSFKALYYYWLEKISYWLADLVLYDTNAQIEWVVKKFHADRKKFFRVFVGSDDSIFYPITQLQNYPITNKFIVHWHGYIVPMDGLETVIQTASILQNHAAQMNDSIIEFRITTRFDKQYERIHAMAEELRIKNIKFFSEAPYEELAKRVNEADVVLGIFGNTIKASLVIPNKVFEGVFCKKPVITMHSSAVEELFGGGESVILVNPNNAEDLAEKILFCKNHAEQALRYAERAYNACMRHVRPEVLGKQVIETIRNCLGS